MKTIREYLAEGLSKENYDKAISNCYAQNNQNILFEKTDCFEDAIAQAFSWYHTPEKTDFWSKIFTGKNR